MSAATAIAAIRTSHGAELGAQEMPATCSAVSALAEYADIINEVIFFQNEGLNATDSKDTRSNIQIGVDMRKIFLLMCASWLMFFTCKKEVELKDIPSCVSSRIDSLVAEAPWNPPSEVWKYNYNGQTVYYIPQHCCDYPSLLVDENCNVICHPDGGIGGNGDGQCIDFMEKRKDGVRIWKDPR